MGAGLSVGVCRRRGETRDVVAFENPFQSTLSQYQIAAAGSCFTFHRATFLAPIAPTTVLANSRPTALLALIALSAVLADSRPTALLAPMALTTVLAD